VAPTLAPGNGRLKIKRVLAVPNPNPAAISIELEGPADELSLRIYSSAFALIAEIKRGSGFAGVNSFPLPPDLMASLASGTWHYEVIARRAAQQDRGKPGSFYLAR
jgi:hypothetical protein